MAEMRIILPLLILAISLFGGHDLMARPTVKQRILVSGDTVLFPSPALITGFAEFLGQTAVSNSKICAGLFTDDSRNPMVTIDLNTGQTNLLYDSQVQLDSGDVAKIPLSCAIGADFVVSAALLGNFTTQAYVLQNITASGQPDGVPREIIRSGDILPNIASFFSAEPPVVNGLRFAFRNDITGIYEYDDSAGSMRTIADGNTLYPGSANPVNTLSQPSIGADEIAFRATGSGGEAGAVVVRGNFGAIEIQPYDGSESPPQVANDSGTDRYFYLDTFGVFEARESLPPIAYIGPGFTGFQDAIESVNNLHAVSGLLGLRGPSAGGVCVYFDATLASDPFGPSHLVRACERPAPAEPEADLLLSPNEQIDGLTVQSWTVSPQAASGYDVVVRANLIGGGSALIFIGDPPQSDADADGIADDQDNCTLVANSDQRDTNGDGFGNACDPDLNDDCAVNFVDLNVFKQVLFTADADADLDGSGVVNFSDLAIVRVLFFGTPGPSGISNACD